MRKRSEAKPPAKTPAADRTVPMQYDDPNAIVVCKTCEEESEVGKCSKKDNGALECPACGAPIEGAAKPPTTKVKEAAPEEDEDAKEDPVKEEPKPKKAPAFQPQMSETQARVMLGMPLKDAPAHEPPPKGYCAECGAEAALVDGKIWLGCGHSDNKGVSFGTVDDPKKARNYGPPAGAPRAVVIGRTLHVSRGRHTFPTVAYGSFHVGPFSASAEVGPDANLVDVARSLRAQLKKIADEAFDEELEWYEQKLNRVKGED